MTDGWYVCSEKPVGPLRMVRWGPYTLETARAVTAALQSVTGHYLVIRDENGNLPTA